MCCARLVHAQPASTSSPSDKKGGISAGVSRFLLRLDEQGLEVSSPWEAHEAKSITEVLWPQIHKAWLKKEQWVGCQEVIDEVLQKWD